MLCFTNLSIDLSTDKRRRVGICYPVDLESYYYYYNIHEKKLLDFDWLRAVQFKCNTSAKSVTPCKKCCTSANYKTKVNILKQIKNQTTNRCE